MFATVRQEAEEVCQRLIASESHITRTEQVRSNLVSGIVSTRSHITIMAALRQDYDPL